MTATNAPFDDFRNLITSVPAPDVKATEKVQAGLNAFTGPSPVLGSWNKKVAWLAGWQGTDAPAIKRPLIAVFAGSHQAAEVMYAGDMLAAAKARVAALTGGKSAVRGMSNSLNAALKVYEMGLEHPVPDMTLEDTLSEHECAAAMAFGMEVVAEGADIIALGNAGMGTALGAAALARGLYGGASEYWAGAADHTAKARIAAVEKAASRPFDGAFDPLTCLRRFGGRDIAGLVGAIIAARHQSIPVILDGFVVCTAAAVIHAINPDAISHCIAGHVSSEPAHEALLDRLGLKSIHNFELPLGDGSGAAFALASLQMAVNGYASLTE